MKETREIPTGPSIGVRDISVPTAQESLVVPRLCGIIKDGWDLGDGNQIIYFAPLTAIRPDGRIDQLDPAFVD